MAPESDTHAAAEPVVRIAFLDVGQGDTTVISSPVTHEAIVVDCVDANAVIDYLQHEQIAHLRGIIVTHLHADHFTGVYNLLINYPSLLGISDDAVVAFNEFPNRRFFERLGLDYDSLIRDSDNHSSDYETMSGPIRTNTKTALENLIDWRSQVRNKHRFAFLHAGAGQPPFSGSLVNSLEIMHPFAADISAVEKLGINNTSIIVRVCGSGSTALLSSDIEPKGWNYLVQNHEHLRSEVFKFPHHGSWKDADVGALLGTVEPSLVVVSVGTQGDNKYDHPNKHVFEAIAARSIHLMCTQVTPKCGAHVLSQRKAILELLNEQASATGRTVVGSAHGCPCAGTIVVELCAKPEIIQPAPMFHKDKIILPHFESHQCSLVMSTSASDQA